MRPVRQEGSQGFQEREEYAPHHLHNHWSDLRFVVVVIIEHPSMIATKYNPIYHVDCQKAVCLV